MISSSFYEYIQGYNTFTFLNLVIKILNFNILHSMGLFLPLLKCCLTFFFKEKIPVN